MAARQEIRTFYQRVKTPPPVFDLQQEGSGTRCILKLPAVTLDGAGFPEQMFTGEGRNKKAAASRAADRALAFLKQQPAFQSFQPRKLLWEVVQQLFSDEALRKEPEFEGHVLLAQQFNAGRLPVQLLGTNRNVTQWAKQHLPAASSDPEAFLCHIQAQLAQESMPEAVGRDVEVDASHRCLTRKLPYRGRKGFEIVEALNATVKHGDGRICRCVLIPAELRLYCSKDMSEVAFNGGGYFLSKLATALHTSTEDLLYWDKFGRDREVYLRPEDTPDDMDDPYLLELLRTFLGPQPGKKMTAGTVADAEKTQDNIQISSADSSADDGSQKFVLTEVRQPCLYSQAGNSQLNQRASWLIGKQVHGDALVSYCRLRPCEWRTPSVKWASFSILLLKAWAGAAMPEPDYALNCKAPLLATLPSIYRNPKSWIGKLPLDLLTQHARPGICTSGPEYLCKPLSDDPDAAWECSASLSLAGESLPLTAEVAECPNEDAARQQAALLLLHSFQQRFIAILQPGGLATNAAASSDAPLDSLETLKQGEGEVPPALAVIRYTYRVMCLEGEFSGCILGEGTAAFEWGSGGALPQVEALIEACKPGGIASCILSLPLDVHNPLVSLRAKSRLEVRPEQKVRFVGVAQNGQDIFIPPMSTQRFEKMTALLKEHKAQTVLDIGCGDGRLIEHLLKQVKDGSMPLRKIVGVDLDGVAVRRGLRRMLTRCADCFAGENAPELELYQADIACQAASTPEAWGSFLSIDAAVFQEVVEHLDPLPLKWLGPCLLGALQPRILLLSTPNIDYNSVLHHLQSQMLPNGLRNSDHRFEWTRAQLKQWCDQLAQEFGYRVSYQDLGRAAEEAKAFSDPAAAFHGKDVGLSTQIAIFEQCDASHAIGGGEAAFSGIEGDHALFSLIYPPSSEISPSAVVERQQSRSTNGLCKEAEPAKGLVDTAGLEGASQGEEQGAKRPRITNGGCTSGQHYAAFS